MFDLTVVMSLAGPITSMQDIDNKLMEPLAEYIHDHILGEPEDETVEDVAYACGKVKELLYSMDEGVRNDV